MNFENFPEDIQEIIIDKAIDAFEQDINLLEKEFKNFNTNLHELETKALCLKNKILSMKHSLKLYDMYYKDFEHEVVNNLDKKSILSYANVFEDNDFYKSKIVIEHYTEQIYSIIYWIEKICESYQEDYQHLKSMNVKREIEIYKQYYKCWFQIEFIQNSVLIGETILKLENAKIEYRYLMDTIHRIYKEERYKREFEENPHEYDGIIW